jgi:hypothetical protein
MEFVQLNCCIFPKSTKAMRLFLILILIVLFSCQGEQTSSEKKNDSIARENIDSNRLAIDSVSRGYQLPQAYSGEEPEYKAISNPDLKSGMIVPDPFEPILALHAILPGNFKLEDNEYTDSRMELIWWNCPNCPKKKITYEYIGDDAYDFPFDDINTTLFTASFDLGEKIFGRNYGIGNVYKGCKGLETDEFFFGFGRIRKLFICIRSRNCSCRKAQLVVRLHLFQRRRRRCIYTCSFFLHQQREIL